MQIGKVAIHKNIPEINCLLIKVKHLIKIVPLTFPAGLPNSVEDFSQCFINPDGSYSLPNCPTASFSLKPEEYSHWLGQHEVLKRDRRRRIDNSKLAVEFFPAEYVYEHNQDGKEYRYERHKVDYSHSWRWYYILISCWLFIDSLNSNSYDTTSVDSIFYL